MHPVEHSCLFSISKQAVNPDLCGRDFYYKNL